MSGKFAYMKNERDAGVFNPFNIVQHFSAAPPRPLQYLYPRLCLYLPSHISLNICLSAYLFNSAVTHL